MFLELKILHLFLSQVICIDELKTDYKNPIEQCNSLNQVCFAFLLALVLPEYLLHVIFTFLFVLSFQLGGLCWNIPLIAYHCHRYIRRPVMTGPGIYDPTTILNKNELQRALREGWIKLGFYLISFFYYLYAMIYMMVTS
ncbi:CNI1 protein, partial [Dicrurus megarhynchus]|nr:CNI1 protein [Dicrurus megarhynchus]